MKVSRCLRFVLLISITAASSPICKGQSIGFQITPDHTGQLFFPSMSPPLSLRWSLNFGQYIWTGSPIIAGNRIFLMTNGYRGTPPYLYALNAQTGAVLWKVAVPGNGWWTGAAYENGMIFAVDYDPPSDGASLYAYSAIDGHQLWSAIPTSGTNFDPPTARNGIVYAMINGVYALRESDGTVLFHTTDIPDAYSIPAVAADGVYVSGDCPNTYKIDPTTGKQIWAFTTYNCASPFGHSVAIYQGLAYVRGANKGFQYQTDGITLSAADGSYVGGFNSLYAPAFWQNTALFTEPSIVTAIDVNTSLPLWIALPPTGDSFYCGPIVVDGVAYVGSGKGYMYGYTMDTASLVFSANLGQGFSCGENQGPPMPGMSAGEGLLAFSAGTELFVYQFDNFGKWQFVPTKPCRLLDTRQTHNPIQAGTSQDFDIPQLGGCNIPATATAYSLNVTVAPHGSLDYVTVWPTMEAQPTVSTMNSPDGRVKANAAIVPAGYNDNISVYASDTIDLILDINGYFTPAASGTLEFYPMTPCRVVDTRNAKGPLGGPRLAANGTRDFPIESSSCIPAGVNPQAYAFNVTVVPNPTGQPLNYLTVWPTGQSQPTVSTLNNPTATAVANAAVVQAGTGGDIDVYSYNTTDLVIDIDGYFAPPGQGGLSLYPTTPCRALDTRSGKGAFSGELTVNMAGSICSPPSTAQAYLLNATVIPTGSLDYLTLWQDGQQQPTASTLNAWDGAVASNMAIVPTNNGSIDAYAAGVTQLLLDISGYFAP